MKGPASCETGSSLVSSNDESCTAKGVPLDRKALGGRGDCSSKE